MIMTTLERKQTQGPLPTKAPVTPRADMAQQLKQKDIDYLATITELGEATVKGMATLYGDSTESAYFRLNKLAGQGRLTKTRGNTRADVNKYRIKPVDVK